MGGTNIDLWITAPVKCRCRTIAQSIITMDIKYDKITETADRFRNLQLYFLIEIIIDIIDLFFYMRGQSIVPDLDSPRLFGTQIECLSFIPIEIDLKPGSATDKAVTWQFCQNCRIRIFLTQPILRRDSHIRC